MLLFKTKLALELLLDIINRYFIYYKPVIRITKWAFIKWNNNDIDNILIIKKWFKTMKSVSKITLIKYQALIQNLFNLREFGMIHQLVYSIKNNYSIYKMEVELEIKFNRLKKLKTTIDF